MEQLPLTVSVADSEALSTTVWAVHVYRPECFSCALEMLRSPTASFCVGKRQWGEHLNIPDHNPVFNAQTKRLVFIFCLFSVGRNYPFYSPRWLAGSAPRTCRSQWGNHPVTR